MDDVITQLPSSPREDPLSPECSPSVATPPPIEREINIMTQGELDCLRESYSFPPLSIQIRLPEVNENIASTCLGEVSFYEASFHASLRLPLYPISRRILYLYNICPPSSFPMHGEVSFAQWCYGKRCNKSLVLSMTGQERLDRILNSLVGGDFHLIKEVLKSKSFHKCFKLTPQSMTSSGRDILTGGAPPVAGDEGRAHARALARRPGQIHGYLRAQIRWYYLHSFPKYESGGEGGNHWREMPLDNIPDIMPYKKGKAASDAKKKGPMSPFEEKKKRYFVKFPAKARASPNKLTSKAVTSPTTEESTSANPGVILGLNASILQNPIVTEKLLEGMIPPLNKEEVGKLDLD
ncbi:hypothetical protein Acr_01g0008610 [Actinidia rufa]|uniref:Uncharacterized protein n=1 Tax=Actinidia rufa TaxID=165716 RepID=A0A7J0E449_9ERIC|nr:hypothetical protein Acr_01g0008610 [Actinidia rufa]